MTEKTADPAQLREEVDRKRAELVETVDQLQGKVDRVGRVPLGLAVAGGVGVLLVVILLLRRR